MGDRKDWTRWWRRFLGLSQDKSLQTVDILRQRYVEEMQQSELFQQHAETMHYPQFRDKLIQLGAEKNKNAERIAEKIVALGGKLPDLQEHRASHENSWQTLRTALEEENRIADRLVAQLPGIEPDHPEIMQLLRQIAQQQRKHREELQDMLMRSDPFALSLA